MFERAPILIILLSITALGGCSPMTLLSAVSPSGHYQRIADLAYGGHEYQRLDVYRPKGAEPGAPLVVYFYGGGWRKGSKDEFEFVASSLTRAGLVVVIPDYRRFPEVSFPDFIDDGARATAWAIALRLLADSPFFTNECGFDPRTGYATMELQLRFLSDE